MGECCDKSVEPAGETCQYSTHSENCGIQDQILIRTHCCSIFVHGRTPKLYFFVYEIKSFMASEGDIYLNLYATEHADAAQELSVFAKRVFFSIEADMSVNRSGLRSCWSQRHNLPPRAAPFLVGSRLSKICNPVL